MLREFSQHLSAALIVAIVGHDAAASNWSVAPRGSTPLDTTANGGMAEMSGIALVGAEKGNARFVAIQDTMAQVVEIQVTLLADGTITTAAAVGSISLAVASDYEAVAFTNPLRNSIFVADESTSSIREFALKNGDELQRFGLPPPFDSWRDNFGLESLTLSADGRALWTANEEALSVDGSRATSDAGTTVRLVDLVFGEDFSLSTSRQFAYEVEPVHGIHLPSEATRSGLVDMVALPGGGLLSLERSLAFDLQTGLPTFQSRIYEINFAGATEISGDSFLSGLAGRTYVPAGKELLWRGEAGGFLGQNLEGLALGPRLAEDKWSLVGIVDDGDPLSGNTLVAFELSRTKPLLAGDYNGSGQVEQGDLDLVLLHWGRDAAVPPVGWTGPQPAGIIDQGELDGVLLPWGNSALAATSVPVPQALVLVLTATGMVPAIGMWPARRERLP